MTSRVPVACQCPCDICQTPCEQPATQEDLLCDWCRPECPGYHNAQNVMRVLARYSDQVLGEVKIV